MIVISQKFIYRSDLERNRNLIYVFGDNEQRVGLGGQAAEMRGEPNAFGIRTKRSPASGDADFWSDDDFAMNCIMLDNDLSELTQLVQQNPRYQGIVLPQDGLGTGFSQMPERCPRTFEYLGHILILIRAMGD